MQSTITNYFMRTLKTGSILLIISFVFNSCSLNYFYTYGHDNAHTGKVQIIPIKPVSGTYVTLNDSLIIKNKSVKSLTLENLPYGEYTIHFSSYNPAYKYKLDENMLLKIEDGTTVTKIVGVPPFSNSYWLYGGLSTLGVCLLLLTQGH